MASAIIIAILLAIIQGLTEFLPVSSSGHLALVEHLFGIRGEGAGTSVLFEIAVHVGTLGAIVLVYRGKIRELLSNLVSFIRSGLRITGESGTGVRYLGWIVLGSVPAGLIGVLLHDPITGLFNAPRVTAALLVATGLFLFLGRNRTGGGGLTWWIVLLIGAAQAVAVLPGCSRSGWTITTALLLGVGFELAAEFSFLLSIPAIIGALVFELIGGTPEAVIADLPVLLMAAVVSFLAGWAALRLILGALRAGIMHRFGFYLVPVGIAAFFYFAR